MAGFEVASAIGSQPSRDMLHIGNDLSPNQRAHIDPAQGGLLRRLLSGRAAGTAMRFVDGEDRRGSSILQRPEKVVGDGFEQLTFDGAVAPASSAQSLENPHRVLR
jgi:hypothetical protein